jgi:photosystem II stability/assembly factor-like uncharacterized protein
MGCGAGGPDDSDAWSLAQRGCNIRSLSFGSDSLGWAVGNPLAWEGGAQGVYRSDDGGRNWELCEGMIEGRRASELLPDRIDQLRSPVQVLCLEGRVLLVSWASSAGGPPPRQAQGSAVLASSDDGATWQPILSLPTVEDSVLSLSAGDEDHLWALCGSRDRNAPKRPYLLASDDAGRSWQRLPEGAYGSPFYGLRVLHSPTLVFVNAADGWSLLGPADYETSPIQFVSTTADGGQTWQAATQPLPADEPIFLRGFSALDGRRAWSTACSVQREPSELLSTADGSRTWARSPVDGSVLLGVYFHDVDHGWVIAVRGKRNVILGTRDGGQRWEAQFTVESVDSSGIYDWVFCAGGDTLFASNGRVLLSRPLPGGAE